MPKRFNMLLLEIGKYINACVCCRCISRYMDGQVVTWTIDALPVIGTVDMLAYIDIYGFDSIRYTPVLNV